MNPKGEKGSGEVNVSPRTAYRATREAEARILLLIDGFSRKTSRPRTLEGRVKLAKLDFLLRYPRHLATILGSRGLKAAERESLDRQDSPLESRMMRYRYGPWDPSYFAVLGSLVGRRLIEVVPAEGLRRTARASPRPTRTSPRWKNACWTTWRDSMCHSSAIS